MSGDREGNTGDPMADLPPIEVARELVEALESGAEARAARCVQALNVDSELYQQVGRIARDIHNNMVAFLSGSELLEMTHGETEETRKRLRHVIDLTDSAAHETLNAAESIKEVVHELQAGLDAGSVDDAALRDALVHIGDRVNGIVLAQSYQDLSGQIITRAITLVSNIEAQLIDLLTLAGLEESTAEELVKQQAENDNRGHGPRVAGTTTGDSLAGQDEVDDLLTSLGF